MHIQRTSSFVTSRLFFCVFIHNVLYYNHEYCNIPGPRETTWQTNKVITPTKISLSIGLEKEGCDGDKSAEESEPVNK